MAEVRAELAFTRNMGNYETVRVGFTASDTVRDGETLQEAMDRVYKEVDAQLETKNDEITKALKNRK